MMLANLGSYWCSGVTREDPHTAGEKGEDKETAHRDTLYQYDRKRVNAEAQKALGGETLAAYPSSLEEHELTQRRWNQKA